MKQMEENMKIITSSSVADGNWTPGPWSYGGRFTGGIYGNGGRQLAIICQKRLPFKSDEEEAQANARLIAAAPDLLRALGLMLDRFGGSDEDYLDARSIEAARAAIEKATINL